VDAEDVPRLLAGTFDKEAAKEKMVKKVGQPTFP
jgi:hypothetical protein